MNIAMRSGGGPVGVANNHRRGSFVRSLVRLRFCGVIRASRLTGGERQPRIY